MERVIYCPDDSKLDEANDLARDQFLPIIIGDSQRLTDLKFDRNKVQIVFIPEHQYLKIPRSVLPVNTLLTVEYVDDFATNETFACRLFNKSMDYAIDCGRLSLSSKYRTLFRCLIPVPGEYAGEVYDQDGVLASFDIKVVP